MVTIVEKNNRQERERSREGGREGRETRVYERENVQIVIMIDSDKNMYSY